jgi:hypothetical protein
VAIVNAEGAIHVSEVWSQLWKTGSICDDSRGLVLG